MCTHVFAYFIYIYMYVHIFLPGFILYRNGIILHTFFFFWLCQVACVVLFPQSRTEPRPSAVEAQSPNHWTAGQFSHLFIIYCFYSGLFLFTALKSISFYKISTV